jgi:hypothetical protein
MRRTPVALIAAAATTSLVTAAVIAAVGSAQAPTTVSLHLISKSQKGIGFGGNGRPRQGDRFGFGDKVTGDDTGTDRGECTFIGTQALCTVVVRLSKGTLTGTGLLSERSTNAPFPITGGTGAYDGARGTVLITDVNSNTTDLKFTLKP